VRLVNVVFAVLLILKTIRLVTVLNIETESLSRSTWLMVREVLCDNGNLHQTLDLYWRRVCCLLK